MESGGVNAISLATGSTSNVPLLLSVVDFGLAFTRVADTEILLSAFCVSKSCGNTYSTMVKEMSIIVQDEIIDKTYLPHVLAMS